MTAYVAPRKGSVGGNEWSKDIESIERVAPRKGSVGGNSLKEYERDKDGEVAPRKGSVGGNESSSAEAAELEGRSPQGERG